MRLNGRGFRQSGLAQQVERITLLSNIESYKEKEMQKGICVKCQATTVYEVDTSGYSKRGIVISSWGEAGITYFVCATCGYAEMYVLDAKQRAKIADTKGYIEPQL